MSNRRGGKVNRFRQAVEATPQIQNAYNSGLQALLSKERGKIQLSDTVDCEGSVDIDTTVRRLYPQDNRWDYCFSYKGEVFFAEIHSANTGEVDTVIRKLQWLKDWLRVQAPQLNQLKATSGPAYYWIQSKGFNILPGSAQYRRMINEKIKPVSKIVL